jgi:hypothetical protein
MLRGDLGCENGSVDLLQDHEGNEKERERRPGGRELDPVDREVALPCRLPVRRQRLGVPGQDHFVGRCLPHIGDDEDPDDPDAQADRGEDERGGAGSSHRSTSATIDAMVVAPDQA